MGAELKVPTAAEFMRNARGAFSVLRRFGFEEVTVPPSGNRFQLCFAAENRRILVQGEGYGTMASVRLEHDGLELSEIDLVPTAQRPRRAKRSASPGQLEQIREAALRL